MMYMNIIQELRLLLNLLFKAKADAPLFVHRKSQMKNPNDMKNGASNDASIPSAVDENISTVIMLFVSCCIPSLV